MTQKEAHNTTMGYDNTALYNVKLPKQERKEKKIIWRIPKKTVNPTDARQSARLQLPKENPEPSVHLHPVPNASTAEDRKPKEMVRTTKRRRESKVLKQQNKLLTKANPPNMASVGPARHSPATPHPRGTGTFCRQH